MVVSPSSRTNTGTHTSGGARRHTHEHVRTYTGARAHTGTTPTRSGTKTRLWRSREGHREPRLTGTGTLDARRPGPSLPAACPRTEPALAAPPAGPATSPGGRTRRTLHRGGHPCSPAHAPAGPGPRGSTAVGEPAQPLRSPPPGSAPDLIGCGRNNVAFGPRPQPGDGCEDQILPAGAGGPWPGGGDEREMDGQLSQ